MSSVNAIAFSSMSDIQDRAIAAYLGMAVGDALGATVEFLTESEIKYQHGKHLDIKGGGWLHLKPGQVTDDTTMSLALGDSILSGLTVNAFEIAQSYSDWMKEKPVDIGNTVRRGIVHFRYSDTPVVPVSEFDAGNGACMRTLPIALATIDRDKKSVINASRIQAHVTHNNELSDAGTEAVIFIIQNLLSGSTRDECYNHLIENLLSKYPVFDFRLARITNPSGYIVETLQAVFQAFFATDSFEECLIEVVNRGGDADTTGAIAGMLAGACYGSDQIPARWLKKLDPDIYAACEQQAIELLAKSKHIMVSSV